jgi:hypothetical protein
MAQQLAVAAERGGYGVPEASLRDAHREMVGRAEFGDILTPEEVADIFAGLQGKPGAEPPCACVDLPQHPTAAVPSSASVCR